MKSAQFPSMQDGSGPEALVIHDEFVTRGLASRAAAKPSGDYVSADEVIAALVSRLHDAKKKAESAGTRTAKPSPC